MPRAKRSDWQPKGIELLEEGSSVLGPESVEAVIAALNVPASRLAEDREAIERRVKDIAGLLYSEIYYRERPSSGQKRTALTNLSQQLAAASGSLDALDGDSLKLLGQIAAEDKVAQADDLPSRFYNGDHRVDIAKRKLAKLQEWVSSAKQRLSRDDAGRTRFNAEREAVTRLLTLWRDTRPSVAGIDGRRKTKDPTCLQLNALARAALGPVHRAFGTTASLRSICEEVLPGLHSRK